MGNLKFKKIRAELYAGSHIDDCKKEASQLSKAFKCEISFNHNGQEYIADDEGNIAKTNQIYND